MISEFRPPNVFDPLRKAIFLDILQSVIHINPSILSRFIRSWFHLRIYYPLFTDSRHRTMAVSEVMDVNRDELLASANQGGVCVSPYQLRRYITYGLISPRKRSTGRASGVRSLP